MPKAVAAILSIWGMTLASSAYAKPLCTVVADAVTGKVVQQVGACDQRVTPASTFKIALSLMGYDSGYLTNEHLPSLPDGSLDERHAVGWASKGERTMVCARSRDSYAGPAFIVATECSRASRR